MSADLIESGQFLIMEEALHGVEREIRRNDAAFVDNGAGTND